MDSLLIIVPCYNEFNRIPKDCFIRFLKGDNNCKIVFTDDGSWTCNKNVDKRLSHAAIFAVFNNFPYSKGDK